MAIANSNNADLSPIQSNQGSKSSTFPRSGNTPPSALAPAPEQKKVNRRSNKLIINWLHRKLVGTVKKSENTSRARPNPRPPPPPPRVVNKLTHRPQTSNSGKPHFNIEPPTVRRKTVSLNGENELNDIPHDEEDDLSCRPSSVTRDSLWSPASAHEADDDASLRPLPPSIPPSPSPSRSSSSYLSHPHTFKSTAASTKPTTLLSIELGGNGMAHIAQAPLTPQTHAAGRLSSYPHGRHSSLTSGSISFSALSSAGVSRPNSTTVSGNASSTQGTLTVQAPLHTTHHPRNNPRPSSPPLDNASMLTLASSAFGIPGRHGMVGYSSTTASALGAGDSMSYFGGSMAYPDAESTSIVLGDDDRLDERDVDASVRALRPRSSRRGSWDSEESGWSAGLQQAPSVLPDKSLWTANSVRTEGFSIENVAVGQEEDGDCGKDDVGSISITQEDHDTEHSDLSPHSDPSVSPIHGGKAATTDHDSLRPSSTDTVAHAKEFESQRANEEAEPESPKTTCDDGPLA